MTKTFRLLSTTALALAACAIVAGHAVSAEQITVGLITKTNNNPFFVKMKQGFEQEAKKLGMKPLAFAGKVDGDNQGQVDAIENLISAGAKGILITPSNSSAIVPSIKKARDAGLIVIALDTPLNPPDAADATFATDNFKAGELIGAWAKATLGAKAADAKIAMLDLSKDNITVDTLRDTGFLTGFGISTTSHYQNGTEKDPRVVGHDVTAGAEEGGQKAMENLLAKDPDINLVYTINEPAAAGAYQALKSAGKNKGVMIVSIDGGCPGVKNVKAVVIGATSMQFPLLMASKGVEAVAAYAKTGVKPTSIDTGEQLVTDHPVPGVPSITSAEGMKKCWG
jgi:fructose transport system substrate-binding protein